MTYRGHMSNGVVILDDAPKLPNGLSVTVQPIEPSREPPSVDIPTLYDRLRPFIGQARGLPPDASVNLDHYLYGTPKQE